MRISVHYMAQLRQAAGKSQEEIELAEPCSLEALLLQLADARGGVLGRFLRDDRGRVPATLLVFVGETQVDPSEERLLRDGDRITFLTPIAGG